MKNLLSLPNTAPKLWNIKYMSYLLHMNFLITTSSNRLKLLFQQLFDH